MHILITGNPVDGLRYTGPFETHDEAADYGQGDDTDWWVAKLIVPAPPEIDWDKVWPASQRDLVYVDYRDKFDADDVEKLMRGDYPEHTDEWISDAQWTSAREVAEELTKVGGWLEGMDPDDLLEAIVERDTSTPYEDLLRNSDHMLFRYSPHEDDMAFLNEELDDPRAVCELLSLGEEFIPVVEKILPEIQGYQAEGGGYFGATIVFRAHPHDVWVASGDDEIEVTDPFVWLTNPWSGNGCGEVARGCTVRLPYKDVHTDKAAWGYGADSVFGGLSLNDSKVTKIEKEGATT